MLEGALGQRLSFCGGVWSRAVPRYDIARASDSIGAGMSLKAIALGRTLIVRQPIEQSLES